MGWYDCYLRGTNPPCYNNSIFRNAAGQINLDSRLRETYPLGYILFDVEGTKMGPMRFYPSRQFVRQTGIRQE